MSLRSRTIPHTVDQQEVSNQVDGGNALELESSGAEASDNVSFHKFEEKTEAYSS